MTHSVEVTKRVMDLVFIFVRFGVERAITLEAVSV